METSVNNGMCRCCASEGAFKDVKSTYHWMGEEEIYSDMLRDCFDINLEVSEQGQDGGICEVCITQLRNAINFKKQVLHTEEQFKIHLQNKTMFRRQDGGICEVCITQLRNAINFKKQVLHTEEQFKIHLQNKTMFRPNIVKVELQAGEDSDDLGSGDDAFSGPVSSNMYVIARLPRVSEGTLNCGAHNLIYLCLSLSSDSIKAEKF
ncbi:hypothetical protein B5X24_HaOG209699 [Helicoverpa armigera]|uniref:ZAD domain-containing protein n=1 Tax=Helicoverpa armigera TaxID=29058 RepID=A0A2W1BDL3_HELAM|nr:hypothetical protein B5X24_HaOG209699 [Helicoverpa armigera]